MNPTRAGSNEELGGELGKHTNDLTVGLYLWCYTRYLVRVTVVEVGFLRLWSTFFNDRGDFTFNDQDFAPTF